MEPANSTLAAMEPFGLDIWMTGVLREYENVRRGFTTESVHDLRVALRRCRSIADGFMTLDPHPAWKQMKSEGKELFLQLGELRDTQVMQEWVQRIAPFPDEASLRMNGYLTDRENRLKTSASEAIRNFDRKKWSSRIRLLSGRIRLIPPESMVYRHIALERWCEVRELHRQALRNRSHRAYHLMRIGLKKFRYTIENFLPALHALWGEELRELQDLLGDMHDLCVLWQTALAIQAIRDETVRLQWRHRILEERNLRLEKYRGMMAGKSSRLLVWRSALPETDRIKNDAVERIRVWASFRDPDSAHSERVTRLALQLFDQLGLLAIIPKSDMDARGTLEAAGLLHDVGMSAGRKKHQLASYRLIRKLIPPLGWNAEDLRFAALIARFHCGALPRPEQKAFAGLSDAHRNIVFLLSGILRLANAFDFLRRRQIRRLKLEYVNGVLHILASGYSPNDASAEKIAAARHLLEVVCRTPIVIEQQCEPIRNASRLLSVRK
jgi:CHAD domain-containing protein